MKFDSNIEGC